MDKKKSRYWRFFASFITLVLIGVAIFVAAVFVYEKQKEAAAPAPVQNAAQPKPDEIVVTKLPDGSQLVENKTQGYSVTVPENWYLEKSPLGTTVYPNYDPAVSSTAICKIETSILINNDKLNLETWVNNNLHADPTVSVLEDAVSKFNISGYNAIEWIGRFDGVSAVLVYIDYGPKIYEIAPSTLNGGNVVDECKDSLKSFLSTLRL